MKTTTSQKNIPTLRFPGFSGAWEEKKLKDFSTFFSGGTPTSSKKSYYSGSVPFIKSGEINKDKTEQFITELALKSSSAKLVDKGDILYALYGATSGEVSISKISGAINQAILCIRTESDKKWLLEYLKYKKIDIISKFLQGGQGNLSAEIIKSLKINLPQLKEQNKIADFLSGVDAWIDNLKKQKESLESYKKGMMQKIFSQEMRFKDENGKGFGDWEEKRLGEVCEIKKGKQLNRSGLSESVGFPVINGGVSPSGYTNIFNTEAGTITISEGGNSCGYINFLNTKFWSGGHCYSLSDLTPKIHVNFLYIFLKFKEENIMKLRVGSGLPNIQRKDLDKFILKIPEIREQQKISEFLGSVDNMLELKQKQIVAAEEWKKGVMQGLFV